MSCKPAMEIMRPLVFSILQESEEFSKMIDTKKEDWSRFGALPNHWGHDYIIIM